ncbi:maleylpyruvate isomerase family mycothiol-dependent enzyme [Nocardia blacklockiae]|uniref:maleylpyruvate isomerase family mycothiol-dependent enzyme n=1 Tax=Nocardia blacklockiae TaxID=480036 RepID=UPI002B4ABFBE|nr:maleylpyruvate isomerase family mycothiol-dependent enzyme [Nocardia blacklockiae]
MTSLDPAARRDGLLRETDGLAALYLSADDAGVRIPTCPEWTLANLVAHVGGATRWAAAIIAERATERVEFARVPGVRRPHEVGEAARWLRGGARAVVDAVDAVGSETPVWTTAGIVLPAEWWIRRLLHEALAHRADAALALGREVEIVPELAADGLAEFFGLVTVVTRARPPLEAGHSLQVRATDTGDVWTVYRSGDTLTCTDDSSPATVTIRGTAADLLLLLLRRIPADAAGPATTGDPAVLATWLERTRF